MSERTQWDDTVDEAIGQLIDDDTEGFVLVTMEEEDTHLVKATDSVEQDLLPLYILVEELRMMAREAGEPMSPPDILLASGHIAEQRGYHLGDFYSSVPGE